MNPPNPKVDGYIRKNNKWRVELQMLRRILLDTPLAEEIKWRAPCYTFESRNVALLGAFKECCVLSFVQGAMLKDTHHVLVKPGENTRSGRVIRLTQIGCYPISSSGPSSRITCSASSNARVWWSRPMG